MKRLLILLPLFWLASVAAYAQGGAQAYFNTSADHYVKGKRAEAVQSVTEGLKKFPNDAKLKALADKMKQEQKEQEKKEQDKKEQEKKEQEKKEQEKKDQQKKEDQKKEDQKKDDQQKQDQKDKDKGKQDEKKEGEKSEEEKKKDQEKKEGEQQEQKDEEKKENKPEPLKNLNKEKLDKMHITEEKAKMILEAMKNQEKQYLQQNRRKPTKAMDRTKPDW
jgi:Ca-activated chloride channel family protein